MRTEDQARAKPTCKFNCNMLLFLFKGVDENLKFNVF